MKNNTIPIKRAARFHFKEAGKELSRASYNIFFPIAFAAVMSIFAGTAAASSTMTVSQSAVDFGVVAIGTPEVKTVTFTNTGATSINITGITASGTGFSASGFTTPWTLSARAKVTLMIHLAPSVPGTMKGSIKITSTAANPTMTIAASGLGVRQLSASKGTVSFGSIAIGSLAAQSVTLMNYGSKSVYISKITVGGAGFSQSGLAAPLTLAAGRGFTFTTRFAPTAAGAVAGSIVVTSTAFNSTMKMVLTGTGTVTSSAGTLSVTPALVTFGSVPTGLSNTQPMRLSNPGSGSVTISKATLVGSGFKVSGLTVPLTIAAKGSASFNLAFAPSAAGSVTGSLTVASNATDPSLAIRLSGTGIGASALLAATPTTLAFGTVTVNTSRSLSVTLKNTGNSDVKVSSVAVAGTGFSESGVSSGLTLQPEQSATVKLAFAPKAAGSVSGTVTVSSNATNSPARITLSGTGAAASSGHSVALSWDASSSSGVVGYHVYRGTVSGGPYSIITSSEISATDYTDSTVLGGHVYYYVIRAVNSSGDESTNSSQVSATIPAQ